MKTILTQKLIFKTLTIGIILSLIFILISYIWLKEYSWRGITARDVMKINTQKVLDTPSLPSKFYEVYFTIYPNHKDISMTEELFYMLIDPHKKYDCKCDAIGYLTWNNKNTEFEVNMDDLLSWGGYYKFGFGLEKYATPRKCFDFWINHDIYWNKESRYLNGVEELSQKIFEKSIEILDTDEIIRLITMLKPQYRKGEYFDKRYAVLKSVYDKNSPN